MCPRCGHELTIGVANRIEELADRAAGFRPEGAVPFKSLVPLAELIALAVNAGVATKKVQETYFSFIAKFGNEFSVLLEAPEHEIKEITDEKIARLIMLNRAGRMKIQPGYDGVYGKPLLNERAKTSSLEEFVK
jgi:PHP family Zn ribbon phosphoesterase